MLETYSDQLLWILGLFVAVVIVAALVNRFRPMQRPRLRRLVTVFALFATATATGIGFHAADLTSWGNGTLVAAQILQAFTLVSLSATLLLGIVLPAVGVELPMIASDLIVGLGYVVVTLAILAHHGVNPTGALVSGAVVSAVLAISLQSTLGNIVGGVALQLDGSIREGDWIQLESGKQGRVRSVRWRHTVIETRDWSTIMVPNAQLLATSITILGKRDGHAVPQRMWVWFNVDYRFAPSRVIQVVTEALHASSRSRTSPTIRRPAWCAWTSPGTCARASRPTRCATGSSTSRPTIRPARGSAPGSTPRCSAPTSRSRCRPTPRSSSSRTRRAPRGGWSASSTTASPRSRPCTCSAR